MASFQDILRKGVFSVGKGIEAIAERLPASRANKGSKNISAAGNSSAAQALPQLPWDSHHIQSLLTGAERSHLFALIPELSQKKALHLSPGPANFVSMLQKRSAAPIIELDVRRSSVKLDHIETEANAYARGSLTKLPFANASFDFILYPGALEWRADLTDGIDEMGRCLKSNGRCLLSTVHPFFEYLSDPKRGFRKSLGSTFSHLKTAGLFVEELEEISLGQALRLVSVPASLQEDLRPFHSLPFLLLIRSIQVRNK